MELPVELRLKDGSAGIIREATSADAAAIQQLFALTITTADWLPPEIKLHPDFEAVSAEERVLVGVSQDDGRLLGLISVWEPESFVHHLYVAPNCQRLGVGAALLNSLQTWLPKPWRLKCTRPNTNARTFYEANGWQVIDQGEGEQGEYYLMELAK